MKVTPRPNPVKNLSRRLSQIIESRPLLSFVIVLAIVTGLIAAGSYLRAPKKEEIPAKQPKKVTLFDIGTTPTVTFQGQIEKSGVMTVVALAGGVVQRVNITAGQKVTVGQTLVSLSQNYQGGNAASVSRQIAQKQRDLTFATYDQQIDAIHKQRDLANENADNAAKMRDIASQSASDTQSVVDLNTDIINSLQSSIDLLSANPASNSATILATKQYLAQFKGTNAQLQANLRTAQYQSNSDNPPAELAQSQKDLTLKQLDIQEQSLSVSRDISDLSLKIARINEAMYYPASPFKGVVQRVFVHPGQFVAPGTPLALIAGGVTSADVIVAVPQNIARQISPLEPSVISYNGTKISLAPAYVSTEAVSGNQYAVTYHLSSADAEPLTDKTFVSVQIPLGNPDTVLSTIPTIPIDSVFQSESSSLVYVDRDGKAVAVPVKLGAVMGDYVQIEEGLGQGDRVILDRSVIDSDPVEE